MPRLTSPDGASVIVSRQAKDTLLARGYRDPNAPTAKKRGAKSAPAADASHDSEEATDGDEAV